MAYLNGITFIGDLGNVTAYTQKGSDKIILRRKGGRSRGMVKNNAKFAVQRRYGQELGQRAIRLSHMPQLLAGFSLNGKASLFDLTIRSTITAWLPSGTVLRARRVGAAKVLAVG